MRQVIRCVVRSRDKCPGQTWHKAEMRLRGALVDACLAHVAASLVFPDDSDEERGRDSGLPPERLTRTRFPFVAVINGERARVSRNAYGICIDIDLHRKEDAA